MPSFSCNKSEIRPWSEGAKEDLLKNVKIIGTSHQVRQNRVANELSWGYLNDIFKRLTGRTYPILFPETLMNFSYSLSKKSVHLHVFLKIKYEIRKKNENRKFFLSYFEFCKFLLHLYL